MWNFVKQFIRDPLRTGAIVSSSPELAEAMLAPIDFDKAGTVVELGPGNGIFTHMLLARMKPNAKLIAIELNEDFVEELTNIHDPRLTVIHGNALELSSYVETADYVVSGLPLNVFSKEDHEMMLRQIKKILVHAYIQFHYSPLAERYIKKEFPQVAKKFVAMNIPPAIVYTAKA